MRSASFISILSVAMVAAPLPCAPAPGQQRTAAPLRDQSVAIRLDPEATQVRFTVRGFPHTIHGTFKLKSGALAANTATGLAQGEILVDAATGTTGNAGLDRRMQNEILDTARYPAIFFHPEHVRGMFPGTQGTANIILDGVFNMHGADHAMELRLRLERQGDHLTATTHFAVPYVAWGMKSPSTTFQRYSKQALIEVTGKAQVESLKAAPSRHLK